MEFATAIAIVVGVQQRTKVGTMGKKKVEPVFG
jgi:hypothetical protein